MTTIRNAPGGAAATFNDGDSLPITRSPHAANTDNLYITRAVMKAYFDALYEAAGAVVTHEALSDPHTQYLTFAEGNAAYQPIDADLTGIAALAPAALQSVRKNAGNTAWEAYTPGSGGTSTLIEGLAPTWVSATTLGASAGICYIESLGAMLYGAPSNITPSSPTANTWYHVYAYSNAGTLTLEASTTAPVAFATPLGMARSKSGDTSRRYLYSARTNASSQFRQFLFDSSINTFYWVNAALNAAPFRVLSNGSATISTPVDCSAIVPVTSRGVTGFYQNYHATQAFYIAPGDTTVSNVAFSLGIAAVSFVYATVPCSSDQKLNYIVTTGGSGMYIDVYGFPLQR